MEHGLNTMVKRRGCPISLLLHQHGDALCLEEFDVEHGLNTDLLTYNGVFRQ